MKHLLSCVLFLVKYTKHSLHLITDITEELILKIMKKSSFEDVFSSWDTKYAQ